MGAITQLLTVEEFRKLPGDEGAMSRELRHGKAVEIVRPKLKHSLIQHRTRDLLRAIAPPGAFAGVEVAFRALPEYDLRVADVAYVSAARVASADPEDNIHGAPDLVIEVLSPSNTVSEMYDREQLCLENGAREFWALDPDRCQVRVSSPDGHVPIARARRFRYGCLAAPRFQWTQSSITNHANPATRFSPRSTGFGLLL